MNLFTNQKQSHRYKKQTQDYQREKEGEGYFRSMSLTDVCVGSLVMSDSLQPHGLQPVHGILQARTLEWVAISFSKLYPLTAVMVRNVSLCDLWSPQGIIKVNWQKANKQTNKPEMQLFRKGVGFFVFSFFFFQEKRQVATAVCLLL